MQVGPSRLNARLAHRHIIKRVRNNDSQFSRIGYFLKKIGLHIEQLSLDLSGSLALHKIALTILFAWFYPIDFCYIK